MRLRIIGSLHLVAPASRYAMTGPVRSQPSRYPLNQARARAPEGSISSEAQWLELALHSLTSEGHGGAANHASTRSGSDLHGRSAPSNGGAGGGWCCTRSVVAAARAMDWPTLELTGKSVIESLMPV